MNKNNELHFVITFVFCMVWAIIGGLIIGHITSNFVLIVLLAAIWNIPVYYILYNGDET